MPGANVQKPAFQNLLTQDFNSKSQWNEPAAEQLSLAWSQGLWPRQGQNP